MHSLRILVAILVFVALPLSFAQNDESLQEDELIKEIQNIRISLNEISEGNTITFWTSFWIGIGIAMIAIGATIYNSLKLNRQIETHEGEVRHRIRPILVRDYFDDGNTYSIRDGDLNGERFWIKIANKGPLPSVKMKRWMRSGIKYEVNENKNPLEDCEFKYTEMSSLGPGEHVANVIKLSDEEYQELCNGTNYFFELKVEYSEPEDNNKNKDRKFYYHIRGHFEKRTLFQDFIDMN